MNNGHSLLRIFRTIGLALTLGVSMSACATGGTSWKEEVLLHDGQKIIVERSVERGGRHELGQRPPIKEQSLDFTLPGTNESVTWEDHYSEDLGQANFNPMLLEIANGTAYILVAPSGCLSYNKWGRPNPPYVVFQYQGKVWNRIPLQALPSEIRLPNLVISSPDDAEKNARHGVLSVEIIKKENEGFKQPEYKTILREALPKERISEMCEERVLYKGSWILPNDPIARKFIDRQTR